MLAALDSSKWFDVGSFNGFHLQVMMLNIVQFALFQLVFAVKTATDGAICERNNRGRYCNLKFQYTPAATETSDADKCCLQRCVINNNCLWPAREEG